ncbi:synapsin [Malaya genurostris]|uniref:synapsin n=1 Tax=Malaya genurostris TaxID=325434 RepID=UPI0026F3F0AF|nr:synapsin [Malaya genurostris]XP_058468033.1 synapsin [Malaya genurostris]
MPGGPPNIPPPPAPGTAVSPGPVPSSAPPTGAPELSLSFGKGPQRGTSAPSSPAKSRESLLQRVQSLTGAARDQGASIIGAAVSSATRVQPFNKDKCFTLLVLDDQNTDWSKYFRGKRLHGDYDVRVEQAEFREISLTANADAGTLVSFNRGSSKQPKSFRPDFILIRQAPRDGTKDHRSTLLGLKYGGVPSINSLHSLYQFQDKPWVFAHLLQLQRRLGKEAFPLVEQTFFPNPYEMLSWQRYPCILKAGHCHGGKATAKLDNSSALHDAAGLLYGTGLTDGTSYCSLEPYIDAKFDVHIQKIGNNYKAFMRKSISGNWKTNQGSAMLEQISMTEKYKSWIDEVSELFGGMEVCGVTVLVSKEGKEFIISASDSTFQLMGDSQEEDRRQIADLVVGRMQNVCRPSLLTKTTSRTSISSRGGSPSEETSPIPIGTRPATVGGGPPPIPERTTPGVGSIGRHGSFSSQYSEPPDQQTEKVSTLNNIGRRDSQASQSSSVSGVSSASAARSNKGHIGQVSVPDETEDTMKNLRKTFAGIFGDM